MKLLKSALKIAVTFTLVFAFCVSAFAAGRTFSDVPKSGMWYSESVYNIAERGWINGYQNGKFGPADSIQRQDFVSILANVSGADKALYEFTQPFPDVKTGMYFSTSVAWAKYNNVLSGYQNGEFGTGDAITREQLCTILYRFVTDYLNIPSGYTDAELVSFIDRFPDRSKVSPFAEIGFGWAVANGLISGMNGKYLSPQTIASRAQTAAILNSAVSLLTNQENMDTPVDPFAGYEDAYIVAEGNVSSVGWEQSSEVVGAPGSDLVGISFKLENAPDSQAVCAVYFDNGGSITGHNGTPVSGYTVKSVSYNISGRASELFDIYYRCYVSGYGWLGWAKNGEQAGVSGIDGAVQSIAFRLVRKGADAPGSTEGALLSLNTVYYMTASTYGNSGWRETAKTYTHSNADQSVIQALKLRTPENTFSGISYRVYVKDTGFTEWKSDYAQAGTIGKGIEAVEIKVTGFFADAFNVYYRVKTEHVGYSGWAKDGATAGTTGGGLGIQSIEIRLVPKGKAAPGSTANAYRKYDSVDRKAINTLNTIGWDIRKAFDWTVGFKYVTMTLDTGLGVNYFANYGFDNRQGNCYVYAACFYKMAKLLGYEAYWVCGHIQTRSGLQNHGWVEIVQSGQIRVYDPECMSKYPSINAYNFTYGTKGTWKYADHQRLA